MTFLIDMLIGFVSTTVFVLIVSLVPSRATCPRGMVQSMGVTPSGRYVCRFPPVGLENDAPSPPGEVRGMIWCTNGTRPIVVDHKTVGCMRR